MGITASFLALLRRKLLQTCSPTSLNNKLSFHMGHPPPPLPSHHCHGAPQMLPSKPETQTKWEVEKWCHGILSQLSHLRQILSVRIGDGKEEGGACGVSEKDHTAHIRQALKPHPEMELHAVALRFTREGGDIFGWWRATLADGQTRRSTGCKQSPPKYLWGVWP